MAPLPMRTDPELPEIESDLHAIRGGQGPLNGAAVSASRHLLALPRYVLAGDGGPDLLAADIRAAVSRLAAEDDLALVGEYLFRLKEPYKPVTVRMEALADYLGKTTSRAFRGWMEKYVIALLAFDLYQQALKPVIAAPGSRLLAGMGYRLTSVAYDITLGRDYPDHQLTTTTLALEAYRDGVQVFRYCSDPECSVFNGIWCESEDAGHRFLGQVPVIPERTGSDHVAFFYLGQALSVGDTATIRVGQDWDNSACPPIRDHGTRCLAHDAGPIRVTINAPKELVPEYTTREYSSEDPTLSGSQKLPLHPRVDDTPIELLIEHPKFNQRYDVVYRIVR